MISATRAERTSPMLFKKPYKLTLIRTKYGQICLDIKVSDELKANICLLFKIKAQKRDKT